MIYPLNIYILWHSDNYQGLNYAKTIFSSFSRDVAHPLERGIGIPTYFISDPTNLIETINWEASEQICILFFIDEHMTIDEASQKWEQEVLKVYDYCSKNKQTTLFYPIATHKNAGRFSTKLKSLNRLNLYELKEEEKVDELLLQIAFKLSTRFYFLHRNERELPVTVFISHARHDGSELAGIVKKTIDQLKFGLTSFIDVKDIGKGENFEAEITQTITDTESIFLVLDTDEYSSREWCIKEVLYAKNNHRPIIHVNAVKNGTKRVFPYLGNVPSIKLKITETGHSNIREIIATVLLETLRHKYHQRLNQEIIIKIEDPKEVEFCASLALAPELLTLTRDINKQLFLYPDPPLGNEELALLRAGRSHTEFVTPMLYRAQNNLRKDYKENFLLDKIIGLSISENPDLVPHNKLYTLFDHLHLQDTLIEISRYLLVSGAHCAYGGDIEYQIKEFNFTTILSDLIESYMEEYQTEIAPIINHSFYPISERIKDNYDLRGAYKGIIDFKLNENPFDQAFSYKDTPKVAIALTDMRKKMLSQNDAQVFIAGKIRGYKGMISGILEEAYWTLKYQKPIYIIGAFGGISAELINLLLHEHSALIQEDSISNFENNNWQEEYTTYCSYAQELWAENKETIDDRIYYKPLSEFFANHWKQNGNNLNNGLSQEENYILFNSKNMLEITRLILKGLNTFFNKKNQK